MKDNEAPFDIYINELLKEAKINAEYQFSSINELSNALKTASKNQTGNSGYPDFTALVKNFLIIIEDKAERDKLFLKDENNNFVMTVKATKDYALNGALFYAKKILENSSFKKIFIIGCAGSSKYHTLKPVFVNENELVELDEVETFENFSPENIDSYYKKNVLKEDLPEEEELQKIDKIASKLHEDLRNYGNLGAHENPLVVAAILLALSEQKYGFDLSQLTGDEKVSENTDGSILYSKLKASLERSEVADKKERVLNQFTMIKDRPILNTKREEWKNADNPNGKTPLKYFAEFINEHVYKKLNIEKSSEDYIGRFYMEFIRYTGGNAQSLGVVITPKHITELFCDLVDLKPEDKIFDPCCGTGGFLIAGMHRMLNAAENETQKLNIKKHNIYGIELRDDMFSMATTSMILHGDGKSNIICADFFKQNTSEIQRNGITVGFMNPPYSQAKSKETANLSELSFIKNLLECVVKGGRVAVIVPISAMIGKTKNDKFLKADILKNNTLEGVISLNKNTFYGIGTVPCIAIFTAGEAHQPEKLTKFIDFEDDGYEVKKHIGLVETERAKDRKQYLLDCWRGKIKECPSKFMIEVPVKASDEWIHSFFYYNDELPTEQNFKNSVTNYLTFEFNMIASERGYLFDFNANNNDNVNDKMLNLNSRTWKEFFIKDIFKTEKGGSQVPTGAYIERDCLKQGTIPRITVTANNNGVDNFWQNSEHKNYRMYKNFISVSFLGDVFYHEYTASLDMKVHALILRDRDLNRYIANFLIEQIRKSINNISYGNQLSSKNLVSK